MTWPEGMQVRLRRDSSVTAPAWIVLGIGMRPSCLAHDQRIEVMPRPFGLTKTQTSKQEINGDRLR